MKKIFISADIEGTCGISAWSETLKDKPAYPPFAKRMNEEVNAACIGALEAGADYILVRDAHDSARNLDGAQLPRSVQLIRGWGEDPLCMMSGLDDSFYGVVFTGYHDAAGKGGNPLSHTLSTGLVWVSLNGEPLSEGKLNAYTAARLGVPLLAITGDSGICAKMKALVPAVETVAVNSGKGGLVLSMHPEEALDQIRAAVSRACARPREEFALALPEHFQLDLRYAEHPRAYKAGFYPGVQRLDSHTLRFESSDWQEVLRMIHFCV